MGRLSYLIPISEYEQSEKVVLRLLAKGDMEIEIGMGYDLNTVLSEADALLAKDPS